MIGSPVEIARMEDQPVRKDRLRLLGSQATSRFDKSRSAGNRSRSRYGTVSAIGLRCSCSTESARIGSWQNPSLKRSHIRRRSSSTCPESAALPRRPCHTGHRRWRGSPPVWSRNSDTTRSMWPASPGVAASRSNSRINIRNCVGGWYWQRPRRAPSWCPPVLRCCGRWQPHGATPTRTTCARLLRNSTAAISAEIPH